MTNPATGEELTQVCDASVADVDRAARAAHIALTSTAWRAWSGAARGKFLNRLADLIDRDCEALVQAECANTGMPANFARAASVARAASFLRYNAGWADKLFGQTIPIDAPRQLAMTVREPVGVVGAIISWNVPLVNAVAKLAPALAAGCTMVLKASEQAPLTAIHLARLIKEAGLPPGVFNLIIGKGSATPRALVKHPLVNKIAFTGSTATGKQILAAAAASLKRVTLELGGKSPVIILPDADLAKASAAAASGIFANAGQVCIAGSRLFVHETVASEVIERVVECASHLRVGTDDDAEMGPLISQVQQERVLDFIASASADGMNSLVGGKALDRKGFFIEPTVLDGTVNHARVLHEEVFGPVLCVTRFGDTDVEAIAQLVNRNRYGLSANIWTRDISNAFGLASLIDAGTVRINGGAGYDCAVPFGGYKESGIGRENGSAGVESYTETKAITVAL